MSTRRYLKCKLCNSSYIEGDRHSIYKHRMKAKKDGKLCPIDFRAAHRPSLKTKEERKSDRKEWMKAYMGQYRKNQQNAGKKGWIAKKQASKTIKKKSKLAVKPV